MFTDEHRRNVCRQIRQIGLRAFNRFLTVELLTSAAGQSRVRPGRGPLDVLSLTLLAVTCAMHVSRNFADVLTLHLKLLRDADNSSRNPLVRSCKPRKTKRRSKHDPRRADPGILSEEAFVQARKKLPTRYWISLILLLGEKFRAEQGQMLCWGGHRLLAMDGTTLNLQNWRRLRDHFGASSNGKKGGTTQARMLMLTFPLARIPWKYELCPLKRSEKTCATSLLKGLSPGDLLLMDKGFWSYGIFWRIAFQQAFFATRLFQSAKLKTVRQLGKGDFLARYSPSDPKWKQYPSCMKLRVIRYQVPGFRPTALVTNLLDRRITVRQWVGLATRDQAGVTLDAGLYHRRWEIETTFCELKVRQKMEGTLRGRTPQAIEYEVAGHVLLYLMVRWLIVEAAVKAGLDPLRLSYLQALNELADIAPSLLTTSTPRAVRVLMGRLLARIASHEVPPRPGRHYPRPNDTSVRYKGRGHYKLPSKLSAGKA